MVTKNKEIDFTQGHLFKSMLRFSIPFMLGILIQNLYGAVDLLVVGNFATVEDFSAVTIGSQLLSIVTQLIIGLAAGVTVLVGQYFGSKNTDQLKKITGTSIIFFLVVGIFLTIIYILLQGVMVNLMNTPLEAVNKAKEYVFACSFGILFIVGFNVINSILSGLGNSKTSFIFILVACIINIALDLIFVIPFKMGALGVAIATTIAQACSFIVALIYLIKSGIGFKLEKKDIKIVSEELKSFLKIGLPIAIQNVLVSLSFLFITAVINGMGLKATAAVGTVEKLITFLFVPAVALGTTVSTAVAQNNGNNNKERMKKSVIIGILMALIPSIILLTIVLILGDHLASIFSKDVEVIDLAYLYIKSYIFDIIFVSFIFPLNGYFNSINKSWFSLIHSIISTFACRIPLVFIFYSLKNTNLFVIGIAAPLSTLFSLVMCIVFILISKRKSNIKLSSNEIMTDKPNS